MKIAEVEPQLAHKLDHLAKAALQELGFPIDTHYQLKANLLDENGRKKKSNASADNWSPQSGRIEIWFEREPHTQEQAAQTPSEEHRSRVEVPPAPTEGNAPKVFVHPAEAELLRALTRAEATPGWNFVPLKKFRDEILPAANTPSIRTDIERQSVLRLAIEKRLVLTKPVHNPKNPQFPVTTVRVNRLKPEVRAVIGEGEGRDLDIDFRPVEIRGEPLSTTVIRERR